MSKVKIKDLNPAGRTPYGVYSRYDEYLALLMNAVKIVKKSSQEEINFVEEKFIKQQLFENNSVGVDKLTKKYYKVAGEEVDDYGNPKILILTTANGKSLHRPASYDKDVDGAYIIYALPVDTSMSALIKETTDFMTNCDVAMRQNLEACKTPYIVVCKNKDLQLSFEQAIQEKQSGQAVVLVSEELGDGLKAVDIGVNFLVKDFAEARDAERDTLLTKLGIMTANTDKKERVQSAEVNANIGQASDYIYLIIDTFNKQCNSYGIDLEMQFNGSLEEIYLQDNEDEDGNIVDVDVNDVEKGQNTK